MSTAVVHGNELARDVQQLARKLRNVIVRRTQKLRGYCIARLFFHPRTLTLLLSLGMLMLLSTSKARYCSLLPRSHRLKKPSRTGTSRPPSCRTMAVRLLSLSDGVLPPLAPPPLTVLPPPPLPLLPPCSDREKRVRKALAGTSPEAVSRSRTRPGMRAIEGLELSAVGVSAAAAPAAPAA